MASVALLDFSNRVLREMEPLLSQLRHLTANTIEHPQDVGAMQSLIAVTTQAHGTFRLIECFGAELLTAELLELLRATQEGRVQNEFDTAPVLILAGEKLGEYVDYLKSGGPDLPLALLALVNNMRACHGASLLSEALIVSPQFSVPDALSTDLQSGETVADFVEVVASSRLRLMHELVRWFKKPDSSATKKLTRLFATLASASPTKEFRDLWFCAQAISVSLSDGGLAPSAALKLLFGQLERYLQNLHQQGVLHPDLGFPAPLFKNLLYYVALSESGDQTVLEVKKQYRLMELLPPKSSLESARIALGGPGAQLSEAICNSLTKELGEIKLLLERYASILVWDAAGLDTAKTRLQQVSYTFLLLGLNPARLLNDRAIERLEMCRQESDSGGLLTVASDLLQVESALEEYLHGKGRPALFANEFEEILHQAPAVDGALPDGGVGRLSSYQYNLVVDQCLSEAVRSLQSVQSHYLAALADTQRVTSLDDSANVLRSVASALQILPLPEIKPLLGGAATYLSAVANNGSSPTDFEQIAFADLMVSCEFYLDSTLQRQPAAGDLLLHAESALDALQQMLDEHDATIELGHSEIVSGNMNAEMALPIAMDAPSNEPVQAPQRVVADNADAGMLSVFINEALEHLGSINRALVSWRMLGRIEALEEIKGFYHTLKGSGRVVGAIAVAEFATVNEAFVERLIQNGVPDGDTAQNLLEESSGVLPQLINQLAGVTSSRSLSSDLLSEAVEGLDDLMARMGSVGFVKVPFEAIETTADDLDQTHLLEPEITPDHTATRQDGVEIDELEQTLVWSDAELEGSATQSLDVTLLRVFYTECRSHLSALTQMIGNPEHKKTEGDISPLPTSDMQRLLHTLRGSAQTASVPLVVNLVKPLEAATANKLAIGQRFNDEELTVIRNAVGVMGQLVDSLADDDEAPGNLDDVRRQLDDLARSSQRASGQRDKDSQLQDLFIEEASELLTSIRAAAENLSDPSKTQASAQSNLDLLKAELHTLKGGAHVAQFSAIADLTHALEGALNRWTDSIPLSIPRADMLQDVLDAITMNLEQAKTGGSLGQFDWLISELDSDRRFKTKESAQKSTSEAGDGVNDVTQVIENPYTQQPYTESTAAPAISPSDQIRLDAAAVNRLSELSTDINIQHARVHGYFDHLRDGLRDLDKTTDRLRYKLRELQQINDLTLRQLDGSENSDSSINDPDATLQFDRTELDRFTRSGDDSRQLAEILADYDAIRANLSHRLRESEESLALTARLGSDIQQSLLQSRLIRFNQHSQRLNSLVRQTSAKLDKQVDLILLGGERAIDRGLHKALTGPLEHLVRNAIVHGIESPAARIAANKPPVGRVLVTATSDGNFLVVDVSDDGSGVDLSSLSKELPLSEQNLTEHELLQTVFRTGVTTVSEADQHSGRGVGLDAVKRAVNALNGTVSLSSSTTGTTVSIRIPQRVSVHQVVLIELDGMTCGIPVEKVHTVVKAGTEDEVTFEGRQYTIRYLQDMLRLPFNAGLKNDSTLTQVVLVEVLGKCYALKVKEVLGYRELLSSPVGRQISSLKCFSGGSILSNGRCVMMLDLDLLMGQGTSTGSSTNLPKIPIAPDSTASKILIVDDSVTMRLYAQQILQDHRYESVTARDGVDALEQLKTMTPRLILLDIEMPRMNGLELLSRLQENPAYAAIPVVIVSSLSSNEYRQQASDLGVAGYIVKPYREKELLRLIDRLVEAQTSLS